MSHGVIPAAPSSGRHPGRLRTWVVQRPVTSFYLLTFAITWAAWLPQTAHSRGLEPFRAAWLDSPALYVVGGLGPGVAALVITRALEGVGGERRLWKSLMHWRVRVRWWAVALVAYPAVWVALRFWRACPPGSSGAPPVGV